MMHKLTRAALAMFALLMMAAAALAADPGSPYPATSDVSDQKAGSLLVYNYYTSGATSGNAQNTRINITNTSSASLAFVHLFFVADTCQVADSYICLTPNQTASFLASDVDPGVSGYIVAVAVNSDGCPTVFNWLVGDEYVKTSTGHAANLGAEAFAALARTDETCSSTAVLSFTGAGTPATGAAAIYNLVPRVVAASNVPSRADGNDTMIVINRIGGNLGLGMDSLGTLFGIFYNDTENSLSFSFSGGCQFMSSLNNNFPRITPRFETFVPAGRSGWLKVGRQTAGGIVGAVLNTGTTQAAYKGGRNFHKLTLSPTSSLIIPVFPPSCQ